MMRRHLLASVSAALLLTSGTAYSQQSADDILRQLLPGATQASPAPTAATIDPVAVGPDELVRKLSLGSTRAIGTEPLKPLVLAPGREQDAMGSLHAFPSVLSPIAFEQDSDLLKAEGLKQVDAFGQALMNPALANATVVIAVHTNARGSDEFNRSLAALRAKAIVEQLATRQGIQRTRLVALGFGRMVDPAVQMFAPEDRIRVVNLGTTPVQFKDQLAEPAKAPPIVAAAPAEPARKAVRHRAATKKSHDVHKTYAARPKVHVNHEPERKTVQRVVPRSIFAPAAAPATVRSSAAAGGPLPARFPFGRSENPLFIDRANSGGGSDGGNSGGGNAGGGSSGGGSSGGGSSSGGSSSGGSSGGGSSGGGSSGGGSSGGGSSGGGSSGGGAGGGGGGGWSDRRLKRSITWLGRSPAGYDLYSFQYVWGGPFHVGVMAQDLLAIKPEAVLTGPGGFLQVDYAQLDVDMVTLEEWTRRQSLVA
jgi:outer membrane protein OmpA-like peptidoglycan-associated protein